MESLVNYESEDEQDSDLGSKSMEDVISSSSSVSRSARPGSEKDSRLKSKKRSTQNESEANYEAAIGMDASEESPRNEISSSVTTQKDGSKPPSRKDRSKQDTDGSRSHAEHEKYRSSGSGEKNRDRERDRENRSRAEGEGTDQRYKDSSNNNSTRSNNSNRECRERDRSDSDRRKADHRSSSKRDNKDDRERERDRRERDRDRERDRNRDRREKERDRERNRDRDREREKERSDRGDRARDRDRDSHKSKSRNDRPDSSIDSHSQNTNNSGKYGRSNSPKDHRDRRSRHSRSSSRDRSCANVSSSDGMRSQQHHDSLGIGGSMSYSNNSANSNTKTRDYYQYHKPGIETNISSSSSVNNISSSLSFPPLNSSSISNNNVISKEPKSSPTPTLSGEENPNAKVENSMSIQSLTTTGTNTFNGLLQKRKLLWSNKKTEETASKWGGAKFAQDTDGKVASKFMRLMGIKSNPKAEEETTVVSPPTNAPSETMKKQEEMFSSMEHLYEVARQATHTMRGMGLGFSSQTRQF